MTTRYIGARYTPKFMGTYSPTQSYEALSVVDNGMGTTYINNAPVPAGTSLTDRRYWQVYGSANGAILHLQEQVDDMNDGTYPGSLQQQINTNRSNIQTLQSDTADLKQDMLDAQNDISGETQARINADSLINDRIDQIVAPSGTAPNPAEVTDARIGYDGHVYATLGDAIRGQFEDSLHSAGEIEVVGGVVAAPLNNLNTYPANTIYWAGDTCTDALVQNCPMQQPIGRFVVMTLSPSADVDYLRFQFFITQTNASGTSERHIFYRKMWGAWTAWVELGKQSDIDTLLSDTAPIISAFTGKEFLQAGGEIEVTGGVVAAPLDNLNTYPANSMYVAYDQATSSLVDNCPVEQPQGRFMVLTLEAKPSAPYTRIQFFFTRDYDIYFRREWGSWTAWQQIITSKSNANNVYWGSKSIVWLGTSIPAGGAGPQGTNNNGSYPFRTKEILGDNVTIINNAVGSSCLWVLKKDLITAANPYGFDFSYPWERVERCIGLSVAEKTWMINNKNNWADAPATITDADKNRILGYSYEHLVTPYINQNRLWIFDYTNNEDSADGFGTYDQSEPFARYSTKGTLQFLWNMILSANPKSSIFVLGNYYTDNGIHGDQNAYFEDMAQRWSLPWFPVYKHVSATPGVPIETTGGWNGGVWNNNMYPGGHTMTMKQIFAADGLHPHSDVSGKTDKQLGRIIGSWIADQGVWF